MIRISVWHGDLSDPYLRLVTQLGADCLDFGQGDFWPGVKEQGYPDAGQVKAIRRRVRDFGLDINRVTLPDITDEFISAGPGAGASWTTAAGPWRPSPRPGRRSPASASPATPSRGS